MAEIDAFFKLMHDQGASDLHLAAGQQPALRLHGDIERIKYEKLTTDKLRGMLYEITSEEKVKTFEETGDVDFGYEIPDLARYRDQTPGDFRFVVKGPRTTPVPEKENVKRLLTKRK